jgi:hypothetical protein
VEDQQKPSPVWVPSARGFTQVPNALLRDPNLSNGAKVIGALLLSYRWENTWTSISEEALAACIGASVDTVQRYLSQLADAGVVERSRQGWGRWNRYYLVRLLDAAELRYQRSTKRFREPHPNGIKGPHFRGTPNTYLKYNKSQYLGSEKMQNATRDATSGRLKQIGELVHDSRNNQKSDKGIGVPGAPLRRDETMSHTEAPLISASAKRIAVRRAGLTERFGDLSALSNLGLAAKNALDEIEKLGIRDRIERNIRESLETNHPEMSVESDEYTRAFYERVLGINEPAH